MSLCTAQSLVIARPSPYIWKASLKRHYHMTTLFINRIVLYSDLNYLHCEMMSYGQSLIIIWKILLKNPCLKNSNKIFLHLYSPSEHWQNFHMHTFQITAWHKSAMEETKKRQLTQSAAAESTSRWRMFVLEIKAGRVLSHSDQRASVRHCSSQWIGSSGRKQRGREGKTEGGREGGGSRNAVLVKLLFGEKWLQDGGTARPHLLLL